MPNRIVKESITTSETLAQLSDAEERVWWRLLVVVDDFGRFDGRPNVIRGKACAAFLDRFTDAEITAMVDRFATIGLVRRYVVDGRPLLQIVTWERHQQTRAKHSKYPPPPEDDSTGSHVPASDIRCDQGQNDPDIICNQVPADAPDVREARSEKREDDTRAHTPPPDGDEDAPAVVSSPKPSSFDRSCVAGLPDDWTPSPRELEQLTAHGCWDAAKCAREWGLYWASRAHEREGRTNRWDLRFQKLCLEHADRQRACGYAPGKARPKPAAAPAVRDFTGVTAAQREVEMLAEDAAFQAEMARRDAARATTTPTSAAPQAAGGAA